MSALQDHCLTWDCRLGAVYCQLLHHCSMYGGMRLRGAPSSQRHTAACCIGAVLASQHPRVTIEEGQLQSTMHRA